MINLLISLLLPIVFATEIQVFHTGDSSELVSKIKVTGYNKPYERTVVYCQELRNIKKGTVMQVQAKSEVTSPYQFNVMVSSYLALSQDCSVDGSIAELTEASGYNIDKNMHHGLVSAEISYKFKQSFNKVFITFIVYSASNKAYGNCAIRVESDYGNINGILFKVKP